nr:putative protein [Synechococcus elongatus PCC 7942 = FACHB-805]
MARVRVRQHVNPLSQKFQVVTTWPDWQQVYADCDRPLHLDIGCARGRFLLAMATRQPEWNYLGLEIREPLVDEANAIARERELTNLYYHFSNANLDLEPLLRSLPTGILQRVSIQFPDPWFKKRHQKRRVVQPELVQALATALPAGAEVFLQSDVLEVQAEMCEHFAAEPRFQRTCLDWLPENPLPVPTEREIAVQNKQLPVYRALFIRQPAD